MALNISSNKNSLNGKSFVELLGFGEEAKTLEAAGWQFKLTAKALVIENGSSKFEKGLTLDFLQGVAGGALPASQVDQFTQGLQLIISQALGMAGGLPSP